MAPEGLLPHTFPVSSLRCLSDIHIKYHIVSNPLMLWGVELVSTPFLGYLLVLG